MAHRWIWIAAAVLVCFSGVAAAEDKPSGTVTIQSKSVALGIGVSWGDGVLHYNGKSHSFSIKGLTVVDLGVAKVSARGKVYHLGKLEDFTGTFAAAEAGAVVGGGMSAIVLKNEKGVVLELTSTQKGVKLTLAGEGLDVKLK